MASVQLTTKDEVSPYVDAVIESLRSGASPFMDDIGDIYKEAEQQLAPIGETNQLYDAIGVDVLDEYTRSIYSVIYYNVWVIEGHATMVTEKQRRWWFWYLHTVLGGVYERKTEGEPGYAGPNDYVSEAYDMADGDVDTAIDDFLNNSMPD